MIFLWIVVFIASLALLVKSADWLLEASERIGLAIGLSPFIVGVLIVGLGTSFPEVIAAFAALFEGATEIIPATAMGSNIANILLIVGFSAVIGRRLAVTKNLIDLDLPLLAITTVVLLVVSFDGVIVLPESVILILSYVIYLVYTIVYKDDDAGSEFEGVGDILPDREERRGHSKWRKGLFVTYKVVNPKDVGLVVLGAIGLIVGAKYLIESVIQISSVFDIAPSIIAISAVAFGTSLPELLVSLRAASKNKSEVALGNIFGSNVFNALVVVGAPGLFGTLIVDEQTRLIGLPFLAIATLLFVFSGISRRIHMWEGLLYIIIYSLFIGKLFMLF